MPSCPRVLCLTVMLFALVGPAASFANHEGAAQPGQPPAAPAQGAPQAPAEGTQQDGGDEGDTSMLLVLGVIIGLLVLGGGLIVLRERTSPRSDALD